MSYSDIARPVEARINLENVRHNLTQLKSCKPESEIMAVVKANAYGHGALSVARTAVQWGCRRLAVAIMSEAVFLRQNGFGVPLLVFYQPTREEAVYGVNEGIDMSVHSPEGLTLIHDAAAIMQKTARIHIKVDTGMGRGGVLHGQAKELIKQAAGLKYIELAGMYTHFATSDSADKKYAEKQHKRFDALVAWVKKSGIPVDCIHAANSGAILSMEDTGYDFIRPGISLYGYYPSDELDQNVDLRPVMNLVGRITMIKEMPARHSLGYSRTYFTKKPTRTAIVPVGYADGYDRGLSNFGEVYIKGHRLQVCGRVSMDSVIIDLHDYDDIKTGDEALLLGRVRKYSINMWRICRKLRSIPYVVTCNVSARVPRKYLNE